MNILLAATEAAPFAKVGGIGDVIGSLPKVLNQHGMDARVIMPLYGTINQQKYALRYMFSFPLPRRNGTAEVHVFTAEYNDITFYFLKSWPFFGDENSVYTEWNWDMPRFILFNQAVVAAAWELKQRAGWFPDVFHVNDWHTGLIPFLIAEARRTPEWAHIGSIMTIHNMGYQGPYAGGWLWEAGVPGRHQPDLVYQDLTDNLLAIGIAYADKITTVSPRHAIEIQYPYMAYGLEHLIQRRANDLEGILNGLDMAEWNPATDPRIFSNFDSNTFVEKRPPNKANLQERLGLPVRPEVPLIGAVSRLVAQKGFDMAAPALRTLLSTTDVQVVVLGTGEPEVEHAVWRLGQDFGWKMRAILQYNATLAQQFYAGSDIFLMPSHYEPCGTSQMGALRYGSLPLVRETGGLADTVENYDDGPADRGTGFVFTWETPEAILGTMRWAIESFYNKREAWRRMQKRGMQLDFSWEKSAERYAELYREALNRHK
ncbi:MAG: glycogen synthase [Anaerolineae bacterium]